MNMKHSWMRNILGIMICANPNNIWNNILNLIQIGLSMYHHKGFETSILKVGLHFPFGDLKFKLWPKEWLRIKLTIWPLTTKIRETWAKWHWIEMCNATLESFILKWYIFSLWSSSFGACICELWAHKITRPIHNLVLGIFETFACKCKKL